MIERSSSGTLVAIFGGSCNLAKCLIPDAQSVHPPRRGTAGRGRRAWPREGEPSLGQTTIALCCACPAYAGASARAQLPGPPVRLPVIVNRCPVPLPERCSYLPVCPSAQCISHCSTLSRIFARGCLSNAHTTIDVDSALHHHRAKAQSFLLTFPLPALYTLSLDRQSAGSCTIARSQAH